MHRRQLLGMLAATGLVGCARRVSPMPAAALAGAPRDPIRLGYRWIPGTAVTYRTVVTRQQGPWTSVHAEAWRYLATQLDDNGVITLDGKLVGQADRITHGGDEVPLAAPEARQPPARVSLRVRLSGRLVSVSTDDPLDALPHRLLAVALPLSEVVPPATWRDDALATPFARLLRRDAPLASVEGTAALEAVEPTGEGWRAHLSHRGRVRTVDGGPVVQVSGVCTWDTDPGWLHSRTLVARVEPDLGPGGVPLGTLEVRVTREDEDVPGRRRV